MQGVARQWCAISLIPHECNTGGMTSVYLSTDPKADELLATDRFALLVGMLLDQRVR